MCNSLFTVLSKGYFVVETHARTQTWRSAACTYEHIHVVYGSLTCIHAQMPTYALTQRTWVEDSCSYDLRHDTILRFWIMMYKTVLITSALWRIHTICYSNVAGCLYLKPGSSSYIVFVSCNITFLLLQHACWRFTSMGLLPPNLCLVTLVSSE